MSSGDDDLNKSFYLKNDNDDDSNLKHSNLDGLKNGILTEETISSNLTNLGSIADGSKYAYLNLSLPGFGLENIKALAKFKELQTIELSYNQIRDLSVLSELPFLLSLNVSHNRIEKLFDFLPPYNLKEASFSFNHIQEIGNLSNFHYLQTLELNSNLNDNKIKKIEGLEYCQRLKNLNLGHNLIEKIEGLDNLPITNLDLRSNQIKKIEGLDTLKFLRSLNLSGNLIKTLAGIPENLDYLETLDFENNKVSNLTEIEHLVNLNLLRDLNFHHNPIRELEDYRLSVIFKIPKLTTLDRRKIDAGDKVNANNIFNPSAEYIASRDHMTNFIFNMIQDHRVRESTLPSIDSPYPILILCGPGGSGTNEIARKLAEEYPGYFDYVTAHTTRRIKPNEKNKVDYNFIKMQEFEQDVTQGKFICCNEYFGDWYGIQWESIEAVARQGLACVTQMELESLLSFKQTYFEPRCVLIITLDRNVQIQRLLAQNCTESECEIAVNRTEWYAEYNRDHPGFFDAVIVTDNINDGYENLRNLVLNYLGVANQDQQRSIEQTQQNQTNQIQRQLSTLQSSRPKTIEDIKRIEDMYGKEIDIPRSDSFLPSNTVTGNRSQMSHLSDLSQMYNQNLRLKYGSAPAQLLSKGEQAEKSLEKRVSILKNQIDLSNLVNTKSQLSQHLSKQAMQGTISTISWAKWDDSGKKSIEPSIPRGGSNAESNNLQQIKEKRSNQIKYSECSDDTSDDDLTTTHSMKKAGITNPSKIKNSLELRKKKNADASTAMKSERSLSSSNSIEKYF